MSADIEKRMQGIEILLVEDSPTQVERLRHVMEAKGYRTRVARDGKKALEALRDFQAFAKQTGNELLQHVEQDGVFSFLVRRR